MSSLWVINKAGGLIYQQDRFEPLTTAGQGRSQPLSSNEYLILAGTLHGVHAITARLNPNLHAPSNGTNKAGSKVSAGSSTDGIQTLEADGFRLSVMLTPTGTKLVLLTSPAHPTPQHVLAKAYQAYAEHVMRNPFYTLEMPIRVEAFDKAIEALVR